MKSNDDARGFMTTHPTLHIKCVDKAICTPNFCTTFVHRSIHPPLLLYLPSLSLSFLLKDDRPLGQCMKPEHRRLWLAATLA
ncbi:unnamed protein product [Cuscuta campestris]|uniref:Uncharacterized protein n=1 Tax=Cuscuta campestris TaxID=132261 RepID=A0A484LIJ2_9ASTE|nr:unnamed protein product [Cuscuta campestris]